MEVDECISQLQSISLSELQLREAIPILKKLTRLMKSSETRNHIKSEHWVIITEFCKNGSKIMSKSSQSDEELGLLIMLLRFLRNSCGGCFENQENVLNRGPVYNFAKKALEHFLHKKTLIETIMLKISIQLFGNILLCNRDSARIVWPLFFDKFTYLFNFEDDSIKDCTMMVLFYCISEENGSENCKDLLNTKEGCSILSYVTNFYVEEKIKFSDLMMDCLMEQPALLNCYVDMATATRCVFLEMIDTMLDDEDEDFTGSVKNIMNLFVKNITNIKDTKLGPSELVTMLSILCKASLDEDYIGLLKGSRSLLEACIEGLKIIHNLWKQGCTDFSSNADSPYHGLKKNLIRLIANLTYGCKENQDIVRHLDGIPLVLDCCKLDAANPFIKEWCILAIRNLLVNNSENQAIIAGITMGDVVQSDILNDMGIHIEKDDEKLRLWPNSP